MVYKSPPEKKKPEDIKMGTWEHNIPCPPASTEHPTKFFTRIRREQDRDYWIAKHGIKPITFSRQRVKSVDSVGNLVSETRLMEAM
jgi:hypothetical protein